MVEQIKNKLKDYFESQPIQRVWVFGSYSKNEETPESDVDLLVEFTAEDHPGLFTLGKIILDIEKILQKKVDLVEKGTLFPWVEPFVEAEKIEIYERKVKF